MSDSDGMCHTQSEDLKRALLDSARTDAPSPRARRRTLAALELASGMATSTLGTAAAAGSKAASWSAFSLVSQWAGLGAVVAVVGVGVSQPFLRASHVPANPLAPSSLQVKERPAPSPRGQSILGHSPREQPSAPQAARLAPPPRGLESARPVGTQSSSRLGEEVALLRDAREDLVAHRAEAALLTLAEYARRFPHGELGPEAVMLRIDALFALGQRTQAETVAGRFLTANPSSPQAAKIRRMLGSGTDPAEDSPDRHP